MRPGWKIWLVCSETNSGKMFILVQVELACRTEMALGHDNSDMKSSCGFHMLMVRWNASATPSRTQCEPQSWKGRDTKLSSYLTIGG